MKKWSCNSSLAKASLFDNQSISLANLATGARHVPRKLKFLKMFSSFDRKETPSTNNSFSL